MPPAPSEDLLRKSCGWKAFKEGSELLAAAAVVEAAASDTGWRGVVKVGRRRQALRVVMRGPGDLEVHCGCPANQASGEVCAHAVAVGLALCRGVPLGGVALPAMAGQDQPARINCWDVEFMPGWPQAIRRGVLPLRLRLLPDGQPDAFDRWWSTRAAGSAKPDAIQLAQLRGGELRQALQFLLEKRGSGNAQADGPGQLDEGARLFLDDKQLEDGRIEVSMVETGGGDWLELEGELWWCAQDRLLRVGAGALPAELLAAWRQWSDGRTLHVAAESWVLHAIAWREWIECSAEGWWSGQHCGVAPIEFGLELDGEPQRLRAKLRVRHAGGEWMDADGGAGVRVLGWEAGLCLLADGDAQRVALGSLAGQGFLVQGGHSSQLILEGEGRVRDFLTQRATRLPSEWQVSLSASLRRWLERTVLVEPVLEAVGQGDGGVEFELSYRTPEGQSVDAAEIRRCLRGAKVQIGGREVIPSERINQLFDPLLEELEIAQLDGRYVARGAAAELLLNSCKNQDKSLFNRYLQYDQNRPIPAGISADLRPYQVAGYHWICDRLDRFGGALLADDMGLGKTLQTIASVEHLLGVDKTGIALVVVPTSLLGNWQREWQHFAPGRVCRVLHGSGRDVLREEVDPGSVVLTSYATLVRDQAWHLRQTYRVVVADEASLMRNPDTDHARALCKLRTGARLALTGTPVENGVRDLWSIFRFIQPGWLGSRESFAERHAALLEGQAGRMAVERLRLLVSPFLLRRLKEQVAGDLPPRIIIDEVCELSAEQREVYNGLVREGQALVERLTGARQDGAARLLVLTALLRLRQCCVDLALLGLDGLTDLPLPQRSGKMQRLIELLEEAVAGGHRVLVFSQFRRQLLVAEEELQRRGMGCLRLDGATRQRQALVERFQSPDGPPVMLISLKAGGYGLNLTAADVVVHLDPWWNPAVEAQASDRAHRIGQRRPVTVYRLVTRGTVEQKVLELQAGKRAMAAWVDEEGGGEGAGGLTGAELESLLAKG